MREVCAALEADAPGLASEIATRDYPFVPYTKKARRYSEVESMHVFVRDGFLDRYTGAKLLFPGVLRLLSKVLPREFPAHPNWKMSESHIVHWELFPTVDHVVPVARGGADSHENWVSASMLTNQAKSNWTLDELGWHLRPAGRIEDWDGLTGWFLRYARSHEENVADSYIKRWRTAAEKAVQRA